MTSTAPTDRGTCRAGLLAIAAMVTVMWVQEVVDTALSGRLDQFGIEPRDADGLAGIVLAPFLHGGFGHLLANTLPFAVMGALIALSGLARVLAVTVIVGLTSGLGTWLVGGEGSIHIGASGLVFGFAAYLISRGIFDRRVLSAVVGIVIALLYGTVLLGGLVPQEGISWQGHAFGAVGGVLAAKALSRRPQPADPTISKDR